MIDPNDTESIKKSNQQAVPKERVRNRERTPDPNKNRQGKYPMVHSQEFVGGHKLTFDSTPGHRAVEIVHGSGTYWQIAEDGQSTKVTVGNSHEHFKEGVTITVDQNYDIKISGHARISISGGAHIEVKGDVNLVTTGDMNQFVGGNLNTVVTGDHNMHVNGSLNQTAGADFTMKSGGASTMQSGGTMTKKAPKINLN